MATDQLKIYNGALQVVGESELASLTEVRESRRQLDLVWNDGGVRFCLEQGQWNFAMRASRFDYSTQITPSFGYLRAFDKPTDWVATDAVCTDEYFQNPLTRYEDEVSFWFADEDQLFVRYVSDSDNYGMNLAKWPYSFTEYVKAHFAAKIVRKIPGASDRVKDVLTHEERMLRKAKNRDAMGEPPRFLAPGRWVISRHRGNTARRDRGNRGSLIG
jgi:hypothetical protein